eukprot:scaffold324810_cov68-Tisochrysis_lutea.AAC.1
MQYYYAHGEADRALAHVVPAVRGFFHPVTPTTHVFLPSHAALLHAWRGGPRAGACGPCGARLLPLCGVGPGCGRPHWQPA